MRKFEVDASTGVAELPEGKGTADPTVVAAIAKRWKKIADMTGNVGMSEDMSRHFQRSIGGIPRADARKVYLDDKLSVTELFFNHGRVVDHAEMSAYEKILKTFEKHARTGREAFEAFLAQLNQVETATEKSQVAAAKNFERHTS